MNDNWEKILLNWTNDWQLGKYIKLNKWLTTKENILNWINDWQLGKR